jgi:hypothetical protein
MSTDKPESGLRIQSWTRTGMRLEGDECDGRVRALPADLP